MPEANLHAETDLDGIEDGAYSIDYVILHAETESVSIANDYFEKPATLFLEAGKKYIQFSLNHSQWTKELQAPIGDTFVDVDVIGTNKEEDTRVVEFMLDRDLTEPLEFNMHVLIETLEPIYDHRYTVRFDFDVDSLEQLKNVERKASEDNVDTEMVVDNEVQTEVETTTAADEVPNEASNSILFWMITGIILVIAGGVFVYLIWKRSTKNKK
jgi:heme-binding NEAT domain protein